MAESQNSTKQKTKQMIYDGIIKSLEIVVACHAENCTPRLTTRKFISNFDYIKSATKELGASLYRPYRLDVYLDVDNNNGISSLLIESWLFHYDNKIRDTKEGRISAVNKHVGILMRTLYCFVRLLPAYQLSTQSTNCPLSFQVYPAVDNSIEYQFPSQPLKHKFPPILTQFGHFSLSLTYLDSQSIKAVYSPSRSENIPIPALQQKIPKSKIEEPPPPTRRHSVAVVPGPSLPVSEKGISITPPATSHGDLSNTWGTYSGELRSPTQRSNDLIRIPPASTLPPDLLPPELTRNQSRSADSEPKYLLHDHHFGPTKEMDRERSVSMDKERVSRSGRPPQHPDSFSYSSVASSPFSTTPAAPFEIRGGSYTPSEGSNLIGLGDELPPEVSPPFQIPCVGLLSTSPLTGPASTMALLRDHLISGNSKILSNGKSRGPNNVAIVPPPDTLSFPEIPESPFDNFSKDDTNKVDRDSGQGFCGGLLEAPDTECMFDYDDDMPFAVGSVPTDPFLFNKPGNLDNKSDSSKSNQSILAQQCLAPPVLTGFENVNLDGHKNTDKAFARLDQMKEFHFSTLTAKS